MVRHQDEQGVVERTTLVKIIEELYQVFVNSLEVIIILCVNSNLRPTNLYCVDIIMTQDVLPINVKLGSLFVGLVHLPDCFVAHLKHFRLICKCRTKYHGTKKYA